MSRYNPHHKIESILPAAEQWRDRCFVNDGSIFTDGSLWKTKYLDELTEYFVNHPDESDKDFFEKWENQLEEASSETKKLAAEMFWFMMLCPSNIGAERKRENISRVWAWSGEELDEKNKYLSDDVLNGIGSGGTSYNMNRWREAIYFINLLTRFKELSIEQRKSLLKDPWEFAEWLTAIPENETRQLRNMLLYLLFPDTYERIFGFNIKYKIIQKITKKPLKDIRKMSSVAVDQSLHEIREAQEKEYGTKDIDFYLAPVVDLWQERKANTYLFSWNPSKWNWKTFAEDRKKTIQNETVIHSWRCSNTKVQVGDKAYLLRTGVDPKGIIAAGNVVREPYEAAHYDQTLAEQGQTLTYVDIEFTQILDPAQDPFISLTDLENIKIEDQVWNPQSSGIEIKPKAAGVLGKLWEKLTPMSQAGTTAAMPMASKVGTPVNLILYGPPGTGKTFRLTNNYLEKYTDEKSNVSESEWMESIISTLSWWEVIFASMYDLGGKAKVTDIVTHPYFAAKARIQGRRKHLANTCWNQLQAHSRLDSKTVKSAARTEPNVFDKTESSLWELVDNWKEEGAEVINAVEQIKKGSDTQGNIKKRYTFVTFHQSYGYEDFVEGIRPVTSEEEGGQIRYEVLPGIFKKICLLAKDDPETRYAIFIDEINRGNIAKILGELITLIEIDKRAEYAKDGTLVKGMEVTLPYSSELFGVPKNLDIIATMNTADRSIALLDTALRRRFNFEELTPNSSVISGARGDGYIPDGEGGLIDLRALLDAINKRMRFLLHRDQTLGHAYFTSVKDFKALKSVFLNQIIPLLQEYFYEDWHRIQLVFKDIGPNGAKADSQIICHKKINEEEVLGFDHDDYEDVLEYWVAKDREITPDSIRKIYES